MPAHADEAEGARPTAALIGRLLDLTGRQLHCHARNGGIPTPARGTRDLVGYVRHLKRRVSGDEGKTSGPTAKDRMLSARARIAEAEADLMDGTILSRTQVEPKKPETLRVFTNTGLAEL
jgi:hypothetical protein